MPGETGNFRLIEVLCLLMLVAGCATRQRMPAPAGVSANPLPAPVQLQPENGARMHFHPRTLVFKWSDVPGAAGYGIQVDCYLCCDAWRWCSEVGKSTFVEWSLKDPTLTFTFYGDQPGAWRVWALDRNLRPGLPSEWHEFSFSAENAMNPLPRLPTVTALPGPPSSPAHTAPASPQVPLGNAARPPVYDSLVHEPCEWKTPKEGVSPPRALFTPEPEYTDAARKAKVSGTVKLVIDIANDGSVKRVCTLRAVRPDLDEQAVKAVRTWRFEPARENGEPVPYSMTTDISFSLH